MVAYPVRPEPVEGQFRGSTGSPRTDFGKALYLPGQCCKTRTRCVNLAFPGSVSCAKANKNGKKHGPWKLYYPNGQLKSEATFHEGLYTGYYCSYHDNGAKKFEGWYAPIRGNSRDGRKEGEWLIHRRDGVPEERIVYDRGRIIERVALFDSRETSLLRASPVGHPGVGLPDLGLRRPCVLLLAHSSGRPRPAGHTRTAWSSSPLSFGAVERLEPGVETLLGHEFVVGAALGYLALRSRTTIMSAFLIVERRCAMTTAVRSRSISARARWICISELVSTFAVASSRIRTCGSPTMARAKLMSWRWPMLRFPPRSCKGRVVALFELGDEFVSSYCLRGVHDLLVRDAVAVVADVLGHRRAGEQVRLLRYYAHLPVERFEGDVANVHAVDGDPALLDVIQSQEQGDHGCLSGPGRPDEGNRLPAAMVRLTSRRTGSSS